MGTRFHIIFFLFANLVFPQNEIDTRNLTIIENIYFAKNSKTPFSGSAFSFSKLTRKKILEFQIIDGMKNGTYEEWYINGKKKEKGFWKHGNNEGLCSFWFENGQPKKEGVYKNTKGIGPWTYWCPNGNIEREGYRNSGIKSVY